jgi:hypothetical protein
MMAVLAGRGRRDALLANYTNKLKNSSRGGAFKKRKLLLRNYGYPEGKLPGCVIEFNSVSFQK